MELYRMFDLSLATENLTVVKSLKEYNIWIKVGFYDKAVGVML